MKIVECENFYGRIVFDILPGDGCPGATFLDRSDAELFVWAKQRESSIRAMWLPDADEVMNLIDLDKSIDALYRKLLDQAVRPDVVIDG